MALEPIIQPPPFYSLLVLETIPAFVNLYLESSMLYYLRRQASVMCRIRIGGCFFQEIYAYLRT